MKVCKIAGCGGRVKARGWCKKHYERWRSHGDPLGGGTPRGDCLRFLQDNKDYCGEECLIWPYSGNGTGYGKVRNRGVRKYAHVVMLEMTAGPKPTPKHEAAHSCGNRSCVNPQHLRWATPSENQRDRLLHGTHSRGERNSQAKLTAEQVLEILELIKEGMAYREIGRLYGVDQAQVSRIKTGGAWAHLADKAATA